jgi:peptidylprolyl isomerase
MALKQNDFVEIDFIGKLADGGVFDSNIKSELQKLNPQDPNLEQKSKPFVFPLGQQMFIKGVDEFLVGKDLGKHKIELTPEKAFGARDQKMIQTIPERVFKESNQRPVPGMVFQLDGKLAKILSASGGRVMVDFNHPLAGKDVVYEVEVKKHIKDIKEKSAALVEFLFRQPLDFEVKEKKLILQAPTQLAQFAELFKPKFKEILGLDLDIKEVKEKKEEKVDKKEKKK